MAYEQLKKSYMQINFYQFIPTLKTAFTQPWNTNEKQKGPKNCIRWEKVKHVN